jgi:hypothetical protein
MVPKLPVIQWPVPQSALVQQYLAQVVPLDPAHVAVPMQNGPLAPLHAPHTAVVFPSGAAALG